MISPEPPRARLSPCRAFLVSVRRQSEFSDILLMTISLAHSQLASSRAVT